MREVVYKTSSRLILGGGSNVLFTGNYDGLVIKNNLPGIEILRESKLHVWVKAMAGENWHAFVLWCIERNLAGIENLSLIPGQVGAAPMQNIGAYGVETKDVFEELEAIDLSTGELHIFKNADCQFGYRESVFKHVYKDRFIICSVTFRLNKIPHFHIDYGDIKNTLAEMQVFDLSLRAVSDAVISIRSRKLPDPKVLGNAGSFFKNPVIPASQFEQLIATHPLAPSYLQADGQVKIPAGWLIEQCGWKGKVVGHTGAHKSQALVLVNYGDATGNEIWNLALAIQASVKEKFGILIQPEVNVF